MKLRIEPNGLITMLYSDQMVGLLDGGSSVTQRASNVEPCTGGWSANLAPIDGPLLGPFKLRSEALAAEVAWIEDHVLDPYFN